ncbi:MAG: TIGR00270 family protein [Candidatus Nanohaloarchaeota archaeon]|nr:TIGR00270 family protein [Candidatus Nanohaloarchaeota archaeon]
MDELICEVCGNKTPKLYSVIIEGSEMQVCKECASLGKKKQPLPTKKSHKLRKQISEESEEELIEDYPTILKNAILEKYGDLQKFCRSHNLKESWLKKVIDGHIPLTLEEAKKLEKILKIKLIIKQTYTLPEENSKPENTSKKPAFTLGDLLKEKLNLR